MYTTTEVLKHHLTYPQRLQELNGLRSEIVDLRNEFDQKLEECDREISGLNARFQNAELEREAQKKVMLEWETRSLLAQAVNDYHIKQLAIPKDQYRSLRAEGCNYLPYLLSVWAIYYNETLVTRFKIGRKKKEKYLGKADRLFNAELNDLIESIWNSLPDLEREVMIKLWLTRPDIRSSTAHPRPTVEEGISVIRADSEFSPAERQFVEDLLQNAMDEEQKPLFTKTVK